MQKPEVPEVANKVAEVVKAPEVAKAAEVISKVSVKNEAEINTLKSNISRFEKNIKSEEDPEELIGLQKKLAAAKAKLEALQKPEVPEVANKVAEVVKAPEVAKVAPEVVSKAPVKNEAEINTLKSNISRFEKNIKSEEDPEELIGLQKKLAAAKAKLEALQKPEVAEVVIKAPEVTEVELKAAKEKAEQAARANAEQAAKDAAAKAKKNEAIEQELRKTVEERKLKQLTEEAAAKAEKPDSEALKQAAKATNEELAQEAESRISSISREVEVKAKEKALSIPDEHKVVDSSLESMQNRLVRKAVQQDLIDTVNQIDKSNLSNIIDSQVSVAKTAALKAFESAKDPKAKQASLETLKAIQTVETLLKQKDSPLKKEIEGSLGNLIEAAKDNYKKDNLLDEVDSILSDKFVKKVVADSTKEEKLQQMSANLNKQACDGIVNEQLGKVKTDLLSTRRNPATKKLESNISIDSTESVSSVVKTHIDSVGDSQIKGQVDTAKFNLAAKSEAEIKNQITPSFEMIDKRMSIKKNILAQVNNLITEKFDDQQYKTALKTVLPSVPDEQKEKVADSISVIMKKVINAMSQNIESDRDASKVRKIFVPKLEGKAPTSIDSVNAQELESLVHQLGPNGPQMLDRLNQYKEYKGQNVLGKMFTAFLHIDGNRSLREKIAKGN